MLPLNTTPEHPLTLPESVSKCKPKNTAINTNIADFTRHYAQEPCQTLPPSIERDLRGRGAAGKYRIGPTPLHSASSRTAQQIAGIWYRDARISLYSCVECVFAENTHDTTGLGRWLAGDAKID